MRILSALCFLAAIFFVSSISQVALAQDGDQAEAQPTRIEVDDERDVIHFYIAGEEAMRLDAAGLHVRGGIHYGDSLIDRGPDVLTQPSTGQAEGE